MIVTSCIGCGKTTEGRTARARLKRPWVDAAQCGAEYEKTIKAYGVTSMPAFRFWMILMIGVIVNVAVRLAMKLFG